MKKMIALLMAALMVLSLGACGSKTDETKKETESKAADTTEETEANEQTDTTKETEANDDQQAEDIGYDVLVIGVDDTFAPMGFLDENNELVGFDIDLANAVAKKLGVEVKFQVIDWSMKEQELKQGNIDLIWNGYTITDARREEVLFTNAYLDNNQVVVVMADSGIQTLADLDGKVVAAQEDSSAVEAIDSKAEVAATFSDRPEFATNDMALMDMEAGRADAVVADSVLLNYIISHKADPSKYYILEENFGSEEYGIGARKEDTALVDAINKAIEELKADGTAKEISMKWFGEDIVK